MKVVVFSGIFTEALSGAAALVIGSTGLIGGAARYGAGLNNVIYTQHMVIRIGLSATPFAVVAGLVVLLNGVHAGAGIAVASFGLVAVVTGATLGYFADRLDGSRRSRRPQRLAGIHRAD